MADRGYVKTILAGLKPEADSLKRSFTAIFEYLLKDIRFGRAEDGVASTNFGGGFFTATTAAVANEEFSITHSFGRTPYLLIPVLPLDAVDASIVPLQVTRAADAQKVYLSSSETGVSIVVYLEG
jgi:diacylglycerol kinase family enzyme